MLESGDFRDAALRYQRVVGFDDAAVTAAALLGLGEALYRLDQEDQAVATWEAVLDLPETPSTYLAWRNVAAARVRDGDLPGAIAAYRQAERRAPAGDRAEIATRLGWLAKETGDRRAARRHFARGRDMGPAVPAAYVVLGITIIVSLVAMSNDGPQLFAALDLDKAKVAGGEYWRLLSVTLLHDGLLHLLFNMYALYLVGPLVERLYGPRLFILFYLLTAAAASTASFVAGPEPSVGASGAIFGLFGILLVAARVHDPVVDRRSRAILPQIGLIILVNLAFGFVAAGQIDNAAHIGGLLAGIWLGLLISPDRVETLGSKWRLPGGGPGSGGPRLVAATLGVAVLALVIAIGLAIGTPIRRVDAAPPATGSVPAAAVRIGRSRRRGHRRAGGRSAGRR